MPVYTKRKSIRTTESLLVFNLLLKVGISGPEVARAFYRVSDILISSLRGKLTGPALSINVVVPIPGVIFTDHYISVLLSRYLRQLIYTPAALIRIMKRRNGGGKSIPVIVSWSTKEIVVPSKRH
jgi:hypothetical protein